MPAGVSAPISPSGDSSAGQAAPGQGESPRFPRLPTHLPSAPCRARRISSEGYIYVFQPRPGIRANRNGKSAEALRGSTKTKEEGDNNPTAFF